MSALCQNFVQNAWKKELCSNCFKSKDEHLIKLKPLQFDKKVESIIKKGSKPKRSVCFPNDLTEVIGVGGEDWGSDEEDYCSSDGSDDDFPESDLEEDVKELQRITKQNTDFNSTSLNDDVEVKKSYTQLMLGKPVLDKEGKKETLLVTITPFGEDPNRKPIKTISPLIKNTIKEKEESSVVLKSYVKNEEAKNEEKSLLEEITETLENSKNPIQIRKKAQKEIVLNMVKLDQDKDKENKEEEKVKIEKRITLTRTPALKRDTEKPVYQTATKIELMNNKNLKLNKTEVNNNEIEESKDSASTSSEDGKKDITFSSSRELAGEPDGRADPENSEVPALPLSPPPALEVQPSFLHTPIYEKPKIPSKPATVLIRKPVNPNQQVVQIQTLSTFYSEPKVKDDDSLKLGKRRAPRNPDEDRLFSRRGSSGDTVQKASDCPLVSVNPLGEDGIPEPAPRKSLSASTDSIYTADRKEKQNKARFSLKKFLRMGSSKDIKALDPPRLEDKPSLPPQPKPRLVIVHPLDLNGSKVEVLAKTDEYQTKPENEYEQYSPKVKPPPPPRNYEDWSKKPCLPPPKSTEIISKQKQISRSNSFRKTESVYANIGEVRNAIVPNKPQRTASMREREALQQKQLRKASHYEQINVKDHVYDYVSRSSSPDSDSSKNSPKSRALRLNKRSESSIDVSGEYFKYNSSIPRSVSLTYCGSETESEIYSPYSFYGSESEVAEDDHEWIQNGRTHKLRSRKGRSVVHKNLEDNYGAVVVANHEALAQVLENIQQTQHIQPALRGLKALTNLRWTDFGLKPEGGIVVGQRAFYQALWGLHPVTLAVSGGTLTSTNLPLGNYNLNHITEFNDLISRDLLPNGDQDQSDQIQATISVLPSLQICTIQSYGEALKLKLNQNEEAWKEASFVMLQLVNALKSLQAQGIEEMPISLNNFVLCKEFDREGHFKLCVLQGMSSEVVGRAEEKYVTLCACASKALNLLQPTAKITPLIQSVLNHERAVSLTQVKSILEFSLWGPSDVSLGSTIKERELALQRWLDLQRATVLHGLVCARVQLTVYEECHLLFLVRSNARMMCDASLLIESSNMKQAITFVK